MTSSLTSLATVGRYRPCDTDCGTPLALIDLARRAGRISLPATIDSTEVVVDFPMSEIASQLTGYSRFCLLRNGQYAATPAP